MELQQLISYDEWANQRVFKEFKKLPENEYRAEINKLLAHILGAQLVWLSRINTSAKKSEIWPAFTSDEMENLLNENPLKIKSLISRKAETITYSNSSGKEFQNTIEEILTHLIIHGQHHRAQIATLLRKAGTTPPATDFIFFTRL